MNKKEKISAILMVITIIMLIASAIIIAFENKPKNYIFKYQEWIKYKTSIFRFNK